MEKNDPRNILHDIFETYKHTSDFKDREMVEVMVRKREFEENLDAMWANASRNLQQLVTYKEQVKHLKSLGITTMRNSAGKHKLVFTK